MHRPLARRMIRSIAPTSQATGPPAEADLDRSSNGPRSQRVAPPESTRPAGGLPPSEALDRLLARVAPVGLEVVPVGRATGRILAEPIAADRPSPALDVAAMDGCAVRWFDLRRGTVELAPREARAGQPPRTLPLGLAMRIATGAAIPRGADTVVRAEDLDFFAGFVRLRRVPNTGSKGAPGVRPGDHIRRRGENVEAGETVIESGRAIDPAVQAALAAFGRMHVRVHRRARVALVTTGSELVVPPAAPEPWQVRDSNGPALAALLDVLPWARATGPAAPIPDRLDSVCDAFAAALKRHDALLVTGGAFGSPADFSVAALEELGATVVFRSLPIRPGKPVFAAIMTDGRPVLVLPGNPVAALVTARRLAVPLLAALAGSRDPLAFAPPAMVRVEASGEEAFGPLWRYVPARRISSDVAAIVPHRGSADLVAAARSDGFVEWPPGHDGASPIPFYGWTP